MTYGSHPPTPSTGRESRGSVRRTVVAGVLVAVALYLLGVGIGGGRWAVVVAALVLIALAIGVYAVGGARSTTRGWLPGTANVVSASPPPTDVPYGRAELELLISGPGLPPTTVTVYDPRVPVDRWPVTGSALPVQIAIEDRRRVRIRWEAVVPADAPPLHAEDLTGVPAATGDDPYAAATVYADDPDVDADAVLVPTDTAAAAGDVLSGDPLPGDQLPPATTTDAAGPGAATPGALPGTVGPSAAVPASRLPADDLGDPYAAVPARGVPLVPPPRVADVATTYASARPVAAAPINGVGVTLTTTDLERAVAFYADVLGLAVIDRGPGTAYLATGDTRLVLQQVPAAEAVPWHHHLNFEVGDLAASYAALTAAGVVFTSEPRPVSNGQQLGLWAAGFRDPDGHGLALTQWGAAPPAADEAATAPQETPVEAEANAPADVGDGTGSATG